MTATVAPTLYQTMLALDVNHPAVRAAIVDVHHMHALVMSGFADRLEDYDFFTEANTGHADHRAALKIQHAVSMRPNNTIRILIRSIAEPHWGTPHCSKWRGALVEGESAVVREFTPLIGGGIRYEIRANPTRRDGRRRHELRHHDDLANWWRIRAAEAGLALTSDPAIDAPWRLTSDTKTQRTAGIRNGRPNTHRPSNGIVIGTQRFTGYATITDPDKHLDAMVNGIGPAKAYGCGMLLTTRPHQR